MLWLPIVFLISFLVAYFLTPNFIKKLKNKKITGIDVHKKDRTRVAEMGGIVILISLVIGILSSLLFIQTISLLVVTVAIIIIGIIGIYDDLSGIRRKVKAFLPLIASIPFLFLYKDITILFIPFLGDISIGIFYPLFLMPLGIMFSGNAYNMLAGYNGLEAGLGIIASFFLILGSLLTESIETTILMLSLAGACLGFLKYNYYPAKIFPGDSGTFLIGTVIAIGSILGGLEILGIFVLLPQIINGIITVSGLIKGKTVRKFSKLKNGILIPPDKNHLNTLYFIIERHFKLTEKKLVWIFWVLGTVSGLVGLLFYL